MSVTWRARNTTRGGRIRRSAAQQEQHSGGDSTVLTRNCCLTMPCPQGMQIPALQASAHLVLHRRQVHRRAPQDVLGQQERGPAAVEQHIHHPAVAAHHGVV